MLLFYLCKIPSASMLDIDVIENIVLERYNSYGNKSLEYDTSYEFDLVGHFIMCLMASKSKTLREIVVDGEYEVLLKKLKNADAKQIKNELNRCAKLLRSVSQIQEVSPLSNRIKKDMDLMINVLKMLRNHARHLFTDHRNECTLYRIVLRFTFLLELVAEREVEIVRGNVTLPCGKWNLITEKAFKYLLRFEIENFEKFDRLQYAIDNSEDDRLRQLMEKCAEKMIGRAESFDDRELKADQIDEESLYFPPCMANLHQILRRTHRLPYDSRYQYTLFLKDIGLPVEENVLFWRSEYVKPHNSSKCCHCWDEKASRYEYQIYHLYGFIGSHDIKTSHRCDKFTGQLTLRMEGGCPFVHLPRDDLAKSLRGILSERDALSILELTECNRPRTACARYFDCRHANGRKYPRYDVGNESKMKDMISPLYFYNSARRRMCARWDKK